MKKYTFLLYLLQIWYIGEAKIYTVSNNVSAPAQYNSLSAAISAASYGDTIYVMGSQSSYGDFIVNKKLTIIGTGYDVSGTDYNLSVTVGTITLDSTLIAPIDGITLVGINFYRVNYASGDRGYIDNVIIKNCMVRWDIIVCGRNWTIYNNIIDGPIDIGNYPNVFITNNIFYKGQIINSNQSSVFVINNLFIYYNNSYFLDNVKNSNIYNNIFYDNRVSVNNSTSNVFNNNISYNASLDYLLPPAGNSGTNNFQQTDPQFVSLNIPAPGSGSIAIANLKNYNWRLRTTSPGKNAGTDGTDIGIYGGPYPWPGFTGMPNLPVIEKFYIKNPITHKDSTLKIFIKARIQ
ncbi:MAG: hypothetical protein N2662_04260 [Bacteroidales bacterium]|nr:hypothetical protein [Bacteroidales bacterium]